MSSRNGNRSMFNVKRKAKVQRRLKARKLRASAAAAKKAHAQ
jgi:hypothetical protein